MFRVTVCFRLHLTPNIISHFLTVLKVVFLHAPNILSSTHPLQVLSYPVLKRLQESTPNTKSLPEQIQIEQT